MFQRNRQGKRRAVAAAVNWVFFDTLEERRLLSGNAPVAVDDAYNVNEDQALNVNAATGVVANDTDNEADPLTAALDVNVQHGTLALNGDGSFDYTPAANYNGPDSFTYHVNDGTSDSNIATVNITVNAVNDAPVAVDDSGSTTPNNPVIISVLTNDTDVEGDTLTPAIVAQGANGTATVNGDGTITYAPNAGFNGVDSFTYKVNDGTADSNNATVTVTVNTAPVGVADAYNGTEDAPLAVDAVTGVLANDTDADAGATLTAALGAQATSGTVVLAPDGSFTYTPNADFNGSDSFTYTVSDGITTSAPVTVTLTIAAANDAPVAADDAGATNEDTPVTVAAPGVLSNDTDVDGDTLTVDPASLTQPANGTVTINADGSFTYTPNANYNGSDSFTYMATDGTVDSKAATVTITVNAVNDAPVAADDTATTTPGNVVTVNAPGVLANDTDVDGDALSAAIVAQGAHGTAVVNADGSFSYTPTDGTFVGTDTFTYQASDGTLTSNTATVTVTIDNAPVAVDDAFNGTEDADIVVAPANSVLTNDTDADAGQTLTASIVAQPTHGTVTLNADGSFTYTPNANFNGSDSFTYQANDGLLNSAPATVTLTIAAANDAPVAVDDAASTTPNNPVTITVLANDTDADGDTLTPSVVAQASHGTAVVNGDGTITYTPAAGYNGLDSFTYKVNDGTADSNTATVNLTVDTAPVAVDDVANTAEDTPVTVPAAGVLTNDTDADAGATLTATVVDLPLHGTVTLGADGSFTYTPNANYNGPDSFTYKASDGFLQSNLATVNITVTAVNDAPVAVDDTASTTPNNAVTITVLANDTDAEGDTLTPSIVAQGTNGNAVVNGDGSITYTPNLGFNGTDTFTYKVNDGTSDSNTATVTVTVNTAPVAVDDAFNATEDTPLTVDAATGVLANDTDADAGATLTATIATQPAHGTVTLGADGSFTYTPAANFNGSDSFTYTVSDGITTSAPATVTITVAAVNDAPVATDDSFSTPTNTGLTINAPGVLGNDTDPEGDALTAIVVTQPASGILTLNADGSFTYTPNNGFVGNDSFTYKANDGTLDSNTATVTIKVNGAPVATDDAYTAGLNTALTVNAAQGVLANDTDPNTGDTLTATLVTGPTNGTLTLNPDGSFTYTPNNNFLGSDSFTYTASDGSLTSNTATVTITVANQPVAGSFTVTRPPGGPFAISLSGKASNGTSVVLVGQPAFGTVGVDDAGTPDDVTDDVLIYTPDARFSTASDTITYSVVDAAGNSATGEITVNVANFGLVQNPKNPNKQDLVVIGTGGKDNIKFVPAGNNQKGAASFRQIKAIMNGVVLGTFNVTGQIIARGGAGNDVIDGSKVKVACVFYGGAGNDTLHGGKNGDLLYGQAGNDKIIGGKGRDRILGGAGKDDVLA